MSDYRSPRQERTDRLVDRLIAERAPAAAEGTGELREALFDWLFDLYGIHVDVRVEDADALLAGPLAPLLGKARAVDALHHDFQGWCAGCDFAWPCQTHRALNGESRG